MRNHLPFKILSALTRRLVVISMVVALSGCESIVVMLATDECRLTSLEEGACPEGAPFTCEDSLVCYATLQHCMDDFICGGGDDFPRRDDF